MLFVCHPKILHKHCWMKHGNSKSAETFSGPTQNEKFLKHVLPSKARQAGRISRFGIDHSRKYHNRP